MLAMKTSIFACWVARSSTNVPAVTQPPFVNLYVAFAHYTERSKLEEFQEASVSVKDPFCARHRGTDPPFGKPVRRYGEGQADAACVNDG